MTALRAHLSDLRCDTVTALAKQALASRRRAQGAARAAVRDFGVWMRSGATPAQAARVALSTFRALS